MALFLRVEGKGSLWDMRGGGCEQENLLLWSRWNEYVSVSICVGRNYMFDGEYMACILGGGGGGGGRCGEEKSVWVIQHSAEGYFSTPIMCRCVTVGQ